MASWKKADLSQLSEAPQAQGRPFAYVTHVNGDSVPRVLYQGSDSHIHELRLEGGSWKHADLVALAESVDADGFPIAVEAAFSNRPIPRVYYRGRDSHVHEVRLEGGRWHGADLTQLAEAPDAGGNPYAYATESGSDGVVRVVFRAQDGHIHELRLEDGSWKSADLSDLAVLPPSMSDPFAYVTQNGHHPVARVLFRGQDSHVHEVRLEEGSSWKKADLSEMTEAFAAESAPVAYVDPSHHIPRVIYRGSDSHIYELRLEGGWKKADLTSLAGASAAEGRPFGYATPSHDIPRVLFRGGDAHIHELRLEGGEWKKADLSALSGAPDAGGDPVAYVTSDSVPRVVYRATDNHIHELRLE